MSDRIKEKQKTRFTLLQKMYDLSGGDKDKFINGANLADAAGISDVNLLRTEVNYLEDENLVTVKKMKGIPALLRITHEGLQEIENAVLKPDDPTQHFMPINVLFVENIVNSNVQQGNVNSTQNLSITSPEGVKDILRFIQELEKNLYTLNLNTKSLQEMTAEIETIKAQSNSPKPKSSIIGASLNSLRRILEGATGGAIGAQLTGQIPALLALLV